MKRFFTHLRTITHRSTFIAMALVLVLVFVTSPVYAERGYENKSPEELAKMGIYFVDGDYNCDTNDYSAFPPSDSGPLSSERTIWVSGLEPPYILEQFMIETLKNLAKKKGIDPSNTVTQEHVMALVAFAIGEGGDINNSYLFNPMNNGLKAPDLLAGDHVKDGRQSYKSFDAGVEGLTRSFMPFTKDSEGNKISPGTQSRLGDILSEPNSTAQQFMYALTYFGNYEHNKFWAEASLPPKQRSYYEGRIKILKMVEEKYDRLASLVIGTPEREFDIGKILPSKLVYHPNGVDTTAADTELGISQTCECQGAETEFGGCVGSYGDGKIVETAMNLIWPNRDHCRGVDSNGKRTTKFPCPGEYKADATPAYQEVMPTIGAGQGQGWRNNDSFGDPAYSDCGVFVATVIIASGADPKFPRRGTVNQRPYMERNKTKYMRIDPNPATKEIEHLRNSDPLQPGDILITEKGTGHIYLFTGPQEKSRNESAGASWGAGKYKGHVPESTGFYQDSDGQSFIAFRLIK